MKGNYVDEFSSGAKWNYDEDQLTDLTDEGIPPLDFRVVLDECETGASGPHTVVFERKLASGYDDMF